MYNNIIKSSNIYLLTSKRDTLRFELPVGIDFTYSACKIQAMFRLNYNVSNKETILNFQL